MEVAEYGDIGPNTPWSSVLSDVDCVIHLAGRAHIMREIASNPLESFFRVNVEGTLSLAREAVASGVKRLVFVSSVKVNGECTSSGHPFKPDDQPAPVDPYSVSKLEAEKSLRELERQGDLDVVIVRPVLVYGPGVKANFRTMMRVLKAGFPLPLAGLNNRRSLVGVRNLAHLLVKCTGLQAAAHQTFLASDGEDLSTSELLRRLGSLLGRPARLFKFPTPLLEGAAKLLGKGDIVQRICGTLQVDSSRTREVLEWTPPFSVNDELRHTTESFLASP